MKNKFFNSLGYVVIICFIWIAISSFIQRFKCSKMTETEIFLNIPNSFVCNFNNCD